VFACGLRRLVLGAHGVKEEALDYASFSVVLNGLLGCTYISKSYAVCPEEWRGLRRVFLSACILGTIIPGE